MKKLIAFVMRTFITDCPHCHKHFYGFHPYGEQRVIAGIHYRIICHRCEETLNKKGI